MFNMPINNQTSNVVRTKKVNINARIPVKNITPPIYGVRENIEMTISDILKCLTRRAIVHQVLSDGSTIQLTTKNFREDYEGQLQARLKKEAKANKNKITEEIKLEPDVDPIAEVEVKPVEEPTGDIEDVNLINDVDDDMDDHSNEPEEAANVMVTHEYVDGTIAETQGIEPSIPEIEEEDVVDEPVEEKTETQQTNSKKSNKNKKKK